MIVGIDAFRFDPETTGGVGVYTRDLVAALDQYGQRHRYIVFTGKTAGLWKTQACSDRVLFCPVWQHHRDGWLARLSWPWVRRGRNSFGDAFEYECSLRYNRQCARHGVDLLHFPASKIYPADLRPPSLLTCFDLQFKYLPGFFSAAQIESLERSYAKSVRAAALIMAPSRYTADTLREQYGVAESRLRVAPVGIRDAFGVEASRGADAVCRQYGLQPGFLFYPANPWRHKNHRRLFEALALCNQRLGRRLTLVLTGRLQGEVDGVLDDASRLGVREQVCDAGYVPADQLPGFFGAAGMLVFPSLFEGFGIPVLEAMAAGCPVAASGSTSLPELVGDAGLLFDGNDAESIAHAIIAVSTNSALARDLANRGRTRARGYAWSSVVERMEDLYDEVIEAPAIP